MGKTIYILFCVLFLSPVFLLGQIRPPKRPPIRGERMDRGQLQGPEMVGKEGMDTSLEKEKVDINIRIWNLKSHGTFLKENTLDTLRKGYQIFNPIYKNSITSTYTGNYGGSYLDNNFFNRKYSNDFYFLHNHDKFILSPERLDYFNTTTPYTLFDYTQSERQNEQNETRFNVLHSQNVNENLNFTFRYDQAKSDGQYNYQANKNSSVSLYSSYITDQLNIHGGFISNLVRNEENGGMKNDEDLDKKDKDGIIFNLINAKSEYKNNYIFATSEYKLGKSYTDSIIDDNGEDIEIEKFKPYVGFIYKLEIQNNLKFYKEEDGANYDYYENTYNDSTATFDSVRFNKITNIFQIKQYENADKKTSFGKRAYLGIDFIKTVIPRVGDSAYTSSTYNNIYVGGGIFREQGKFWKWNVEGKLYTVGYKSGQTEIDGIISKPIIFLNDSASSIEIKGSLKTLVPDYFQQKFFSNHYRWSNSDFKNEQFMNAEFKYSSPKYHLEAGVNYSLINNYIYNNTSGIPAQTEEELLILAAYFKKEISLKNFNIAGNILWQKASNERYVHLPELSAFVSLNYSFIWSKVLYTTIGADVRYNSAFYADAYAPSTGLFYLQDEKRIGNYPYIDAYASLKLKRTRVFFKWINVGSDFIDGEYFGALHHPMNRRTFRLGAAWIFYD